MVPTSRVFGHLGKKGVLFMLASSLFVLVIFESESGCLGLKNEAFGKGGIPKSDFRSTWISHDSMVHFSRFWVALGPIFMILGALETGSKFDDFSG